MKRTLLLHFFRKKNVNFNNTYQQNEELISIQLIKETKKKLHIFKYLQIIYVNRKANAIVKKDKNKK